MPDRPIPSEWYGPGPYAAKAYLLYNGRAIDALGLDGSPGGMFVLRIDPAQADTFRYEWIIEDPSCPVKWEWDGASGVNRLVVTDLKKFKTRVRVTAVCHHGFEISTQWIAVDFNPEAYKPTESEI